MNELHWFYRLGPLIVLPLVWLILGGVAFVSYRLGRAARKSDVQPSKTSDFLLSSLFGLLSLILSFSFSLAVSRFEHRREMAIKESNAIEASYVRALAMKDVAGVDIIKLYRDYVDKRIDFYRSPDWNKKLENAAPIQEKMKNHFVTISKSERGALESAYSFALTAMFEATNERNFALIKQLPESIYFMIFLFACLAFGTLNYDRGFHKESVHWRTILYIILFGIVFTMIYDIDHPHSGLIRIGQDAMLKLRDSMEI